MAEKPPTDARIKGLLQTLAIADPDYGRFAEQHTLLERYPLPSEQETALGCDLLDVLRESPGQEARFEALLQAPAPDRFDGGLATVPVLVAVAFLLRTHIR
ncbi:MAG: hypothetical protein GY717_16790, partial [Rhodobacteraceae bacterium]|nr:hypothetical protein [Paracoccaceae bacterium]